MCQAGYKAICCRFALCIQLRRVIDYARGNSAQRWDDGARVDAVALRCSQMNGSAASLRFGAIYSTLRERIDIQESDSQHQFPHAIVRVHALLMFLPLKKSL